MESNASCSTYLPPWIPWISASRLQLDASPALRQTPIIKIQSGYLAGTTTRVVALTLRSTQSVKQPNPQQLWNGIVSQLGHQLAHTACHPNFVQILALAGGGTSPGHGATTMATAAEPAPPRHVVMEFTPCSLYDALHTETLVLPRDEIVHIALQVLSGLSFVHGDGQSFGSTLTSRKVMFSGLHHIKLRRFCSEWVYRQTTAGAAGAVPCSASSASSLSQYVMLHQQPASPSSGSTGATGSPPHDQERQECLEHGQRQDLYAFGMVLLEMCTRQKPTPEIFNAIASTRQLDPRFEQIIRATLAVHVEPPNSNSSHHRKKFPSSAAELLAYSIEQLRECDAESNGTMTSPRRSSHTFPSFIHANRYFLELESRTVEQRVTERITQSTTALKRLAAVEEDLVDEQRNFDVVVKQLDQLRLEKTRDEQQLCQFSTIVSDLESHQQRQDEALRKAQQELNEARYRINELLAVVEERDERLAQSKTDRLAIEHERQQLLGEIIHLQGEKHHTVDQKRAVECELAEMAAKVGGEKDAVVELDARYTQAIHRCEQAQKETRTVERQLEALARQLTEMQDERSRYTAALQVCPLGQRDARSSKDLVLTLKEKQISSLHEEILFLTNELQDARSKGVEWESECRRLQEVECVALQDQVAQLRVESTQLKSVVATLENDRTLLTERVTEMARLSHQWKITSDAWQTQFVDLHQQNADAEKARRLRQCLTPNCDAPKYLVKPSGFCIDCDEKMAKQRTSKGSLASVSSSTPRAAAPRGHRRQRSLDGAHAIVTNIKNAPVVDLLKRIQLARECEEDTDERAELLDMVGLIKQLGKLLKDSAVLKEDLPECGALRSVLAVMEQFLSRHLAVVLECCKTLSIAVFNQDRNRIILVADGVVELLLRVLKQHRQEVKIHEIGAVLLTNLAHNCESNRQRILAAGGVDAVLEAMQLFPRHANIQKKSCWALLTLAGSDSTCDQIASLGGIGAAIAAMLNCPDDSDVQHYGSWTLLNLVSGAEQLQQFARREGVAEVAEAALACFPDHRGVQDKCSQILQLIVVPISS